MAHVRAWQVAYEGIVPADFLGALDVVSRAEQWRQNLTETALGDGTPAPSNLVAEVSGQVVGFACIGRWRDAPADATLGELWAMYVHPEHWGAGTGFVLMQATLEHFRKNQFSTGFLWVLEDNARARRFYERQGWQANEMTKHDTIGDARITERRYSVHVT
jgi:GNAT superfamily N-acetyltransferase